MDTLALEPAGWDLTCDAYGNWATFGDATNTNPQTGSGMRLAQDVATRCLSWRSEVYYDTTQGIQYPQILGGPPNLALVSNAYNTEALNVPDCAQAVSSLSYAAGSARKIGDPSTITVSSASGAVGVVTLA